MEDNIKSKDSSPIVQAVSDAYRSGQEDEALEPIIAVDQDSIPVGRMKAGDYVIFYDIRGEREIEITRSLIEEDFTHFPIKKGCFPHFVTMIEYSSSLDVKVAFPPEGRVENTLTEVLSKNKIPSLKIAESEKAVHISYFMNGKREEPFPGEDRIFIPSPEGVASYSHTPEMSASLVSDEIIKNLKETSYQVIVANLANVDVVGHIEDQDAAKQAVEAVDRELGRIMGECEAQGVTLIVTADHGTVEEWFYPDGTIDTGHTRNPVPFILADFHSKNPEGFRLKEKGGLIDITPTILELHGLKKPKEMTGKSLIADIKNEDNSSRRTLLLILDGWGMREKETGNLISEADTPHYDRMWKRFPHSVLDSSGEAVGMPDGTVGNSEAGHLHIGAGRRIFLDRVKIDRSIADGSFFTNHAFQWAMENAKKEKRALHFLGIVSHYSSHGTIDHLFALLQMAKDLGLEEIYVHALIGRRGEKPESGTIYVNKVEEKCNTIGLGKVVTVMGRYWALDREENWDRVEKTYRALVYGEGTQIVVR